MLIFIDGELRGWPGDGSLRDLLYLLQSCVLSTGVCPALLNPKGLCQLPLLLTQLRSDEGHQSAIQRDKTDEEEEDLRGASPHQCR